MSSRRASRGQATVEVALLLPVIVVVALAVVQVGIVVRGEVMVAAAAREAARAAAIGSSEAAVREAAERAAGLDPARLAVEVATDGDFVSATVRYRDPTDVALVGRLTGPVTLAATVTMRREG